MPDKKQDAVSLSLSGRVALITGGSRGIGAATVRMFREAGAKVAFSYLTHKAKAQALADECGGSEHCVAIKQELGSAEDGQALVAATVAAFGRIDCLIANHGIWPPHDQPIGTMSVEQWRTTL